MAQNPGILIPSAINTPDSADTFPTHYSSKGLGGPFFVDSLAELDQIPTQRRKTGCEAFVTTELKWYQWSGTAWEERKVPSHTHIGVYEPANANIQAHVISAHAPSNAQKNSDITKAEIEAKLTGTISSHGHTPDHTHPDVVALNKISESAGEPTWNGGAWPGGSGGGTPATVVEVFDGESSVGVATKYAREDHKHGGQALPLATDHALEILRVKSDETGVEWFDHDGAAGAHGGAVSKVNRFYDLKIDFGVVGDRTTDDTAAFLAAEAASAHGDTFYLPKGVYRITNRVLWRKRVNIIGDGFCFQVDDSWIDDGRFATISNLTLANGTVIYLDYTSATSTEGFVLTESQSKIKGIGFCDNQDDPAGTIVTGADIAAVSDGFTSGSNAFGVFSVGQAVRVKNFIAGSINNLHAYKVTNVTVNKITVTPAPETTEAAGATVTVTGWKPRSNNPIPLVVRTRDTTIPGSFSAYFVEVDDVCLFGTTYGVKGNGCGALQVGRIYGQCFSPMLDLKYVYHCIKVGTVELWPFWSNKSGARGYMELTSSAIRMGRVDGGTVDRVFTIGCSKTLHFIFTDATTDPDFPFNVSYRMSSLSGGPSGLIFNNLFIDHTNYNVYYEGVDDVHAGYPNVYVTNTINNLYGFTSSDNARGACVYMDSNTHRATLRINSGFNYWQNYHEVFNIEGTENLLYVSNWESCGWDGKGTGAALVHASENSKVFFRDVVWPKFDSSSKLLKSGTGTLNWGAAGTVTGAVQLRGDNGELVAKDSLYVLDRPGVDTTLAYLSSDITTSFIMGNLSSSRANYPTLSSVNYDGNMHGGFPAIALRQYKGSSTDTAANKVLSGAGNVLGEIYFQSSDGVSLGATGAVIKAVTTAEWSSTNSPARLSIGLGGGGIGPYGTTEIVSIESDGMHLPTGKKFYGDGSGLTNLPAAGMPYDPQVGGAGNLWLWYVPASKSYLSNISDDGTGNVNIPAGKSYKINGVALPTTNVAGSDKQLQFNDGGSLAGANIYWDKANIRLGIGTSLPQAPVDVTSQKGSVRLTVAGGAAPGVLTYTAGTSIAAATTVSNGAFGGFFSTYFHDGTDYRNFGYSWFQVNGGVTSNFVPVDYVLLLGRTAATERFRVKSNGAVRFKPIAQPVAGEIGDMYMTTAGVLKVCTTAGVTTNGAARANSTAYAVGDCRQWTTGTTVWECIVAGTSAASPPTIAGTVNEIVTDGTAKWMCIATTTTAAVWQSIGIQT